MTIDEVKARYKITDAQVAEFADKYLRTRQRQRNQAKKIREDLREFRRLKDEGKLPTTAGSR